MRELRELVAQTGDKVFNIQDGLAMELHEGTNEVKEIDRMIESKYGYVGVGGVDNLGLLVLFEMQYEILGYIKGKHLDIARKVLKDSLLKVSSMGDPVDSAIKMVRFQNLVLGLKIGDYIEFNGDRGYVSSVERDDENNLEILLLNGKIKRVNEEDVKLLLKKEEINHISNQTEQVLEIRNVKVGIEGDSDETPTKIIEIEALMQTRDADGNEAFVIKGDYCTVKEDFTLSKDKFKKGHVYRINTVAPPFDIWARDVNDEYDTNDYVLDCKGVYVEI